MGCVFVSFRQPAICGCSEIEGNDKGNGKDDDDEDNEDANEDGNERANEDGNDVEESTFRGGGGRGAERRSGLCEGGGSVCDGGRGGRGNDNDNGNGNECENESESE